MKKQIEALKCQECTGTQSKSNFYKPLEKYCICKDCFNQKFMFQYREVLDTDFGATIEWMCKEYNLPFVQELIYYYENVPNIKDKLECYMNDISLLPMYQNKIVTKEKSDIDFINEDIKGVKEHIEYSLKQHDFNSHNKWLNSLRDALELREKLQGNNNNNTLNIKINNIKTDSFDEILQSIQQAQANQIGNSFNKTSIDIDHKDGVSYISEHILQSLRNNYEIKYGRKSYNEPVYMKLTDRQSKEEINIIINKENEPVYKIAKRCLGIPHIIGGSNPEEGFDCSGLVQYVFKQIGINLPRTSYEQFKVTKEINKSEMKSGDLIFNLDSSHVGIYIGNGEYIHSPKNGDIVRISKLESIDYKPRRI